MLLTDRKIERRVEELDKYRYRDIITIKQFLSKEEETSCVNPDVPEQYEGWNVMENGAYWSGRDRYLWMHTDFIIPKEWVGKRVLGIFDFGNTGAGNNSGFESLLYLDGKPYQGVDVNHKEVFLSTDNLKYKADFRLWSGLEGGGVPTIQEHKIKRADLGWLDEPTDDLYYMANMLLDTIKNLKKEDPLQYQLRAALDEAFLCIDWSVPGSVEFYHSVEMADRKLNDAIDRMDKKSIVNVSCVGHTHIDVAWLWRLKHTREKCARSFSTVLRLMEIFPEYVFLQTQPQLYEYIKNDYPEIYEEMKQKIAEGRWETDGAMWVEADCNIVSGESLTRQILIGSKFFKDEFNKEVKYLWLPDVFGYSWALPQILKKSGIDMFMTTKISWNQYNRMPHDTFFWKGMDGSEVLTHFITTPDPFSEPDSWFYTYNGKLTPRTVKGVWDAYQDKDMNKELLISYGFGDGGGGVNRDMLEQRRRIDKIPGLPNLKPSTAKDYFDKLKKSVSETKRYVHKWDGELYLEYHRGTYTSQAYNKKMNRKLELLYRKAEWMTVMSALKDGSLDKAEQEVLTDGWKIILTNQFHDIIPGSSIHEVYEDSKEDYKIAEKTANTVIENAVSGLVFDGDVAEDAGKNNAITVLNDSFWVRDEIIVLDSDEMGIYKDSDGNILTSQIEAGKTYIQVQSVPSMGHKVVYFEKENKVTDGLGSEDSMNQLVRISINKNRIETPYYTIALNECGQIVELYDKEYDRNILKPSERANVIQMFEDKPLDNDAWDIDIFYQEKMKEVDNLISMEVVENGNLRTVIRMEWNYMQSKVIQDMILYTNSRRIDFKTWVNYHERQQLMKVAFPLDIRSTFSTCDIQYGNVKRPNHWNTSWDQAKFETVAHKWVDLSESNYGVSLLNDSKYGHDIKGDVIRLTLLKSAIHPDHLQDQGEHEFTYSLYPHKGDFIEGDTEKEAFALNQPLTVLSGKVDLPYSSFLGCNNPYIELDAVKKSEDGSCFVVRFHEYTGSRQKVKLDAGFSFLEWTEGDLRERPLTDWNGSKEIELTVNPYEIKTLLFRVK